MPTQIQKQIEEVVKRFQQKYNSFELCEVVSKQDHDKLIEFITQELSTIDRLPHGLKITSYGFDDYNHPTIDRVAEDKYSIRFMRMRFTKRGDWIHEPQPSSRTPSFFKRTQMTLQEAFEKYPKSIEALSNQTTLDTVKEDV